jgi:hypothetical protein
MDSLDREKLSLADDVHVKEKTATEGAERAEKTGRRAHRATGPFRVIWAIAQTV